MVVRKFEAVSLDAALKLVKEAFGPEALILSTQERKNGWFQRPTIEVTAAKKEEAPKVEEKPSRPELTEAALERIFPHRRYVDEVGDRGARESRDARAAREEREERQDRESREARADRARLLRRRDEGEGERRPGEQRSAAIGVAPTGARLRVSPIYEENEAFFLKRGFSPAHAKEFALRLTSDFPAEEVRRSGRIEQLRARLLAPAIRTQGDEVFEMRRTWAAIGTPGSGKTALLVKLGVHLRSRGYRVKLDSCDQRKLLAREEVAGYARLLGAGTEGESIDLLDTSAYRWNDPESIEALKPVCRDRSVLLVLDATSRSAEMLRTIEAAGPVGPQALAFSRLDLVCHPGALYEVLRTSGLPLLVVSQGMRLKEALRFFDSFTFSKLLVQGEI